MVDTNPFIPTFPSDLEDYNSYNYSTDLSSSSSSSYAPLHDGNSSQNVGHSRRRPFKRLIFLSLGAVSAIVFFLVLSPTNILIGDHDDDDGRSKFSFMSSSGSTSSSESSTEPVSYAYYFHSNNGSRGVKEGVSEKTFRLADHEGGESFPWTISMLSWQRTTFHFQPQKNWMNDPDGPLFHKGWYHLFYQYNPDSAVWGNITWGHAVSKDLIHWLHLPIVMIPDHWYDLNGVWTGSATILPNGSIVMIYTGSTNETVQVQNVAFPANVSDPLLLDWVKHSRNPVLLPPAGIKSKDFRDPTTAWNVNGKWQIAIGSKFNTTGIALVYETSDFIEYKLLDGLLHAVPTTGMWECVDFYPVSTNGVNGLDTSVNGPGIKHVLKASLDDNKRDYYAIGTYDPVSNSWVPDDPNLDVGIGLRYDYGKYYASKTFYDQNKKRRVLWGWIGETDTEIADIRKDWSGVQNIPREVVLDLKTKSNLIQWPVEEVETLRQSKEEFGEIEIGIGSVFPLQTGSASQLDIVAEFEIDKNSLERNIEADALYNCSTSNGAAGRGILGPFGLLVLADENLTEQTAVYFYVARGIDGNLNTFFCTDQSRSSLANDVGKKVYGSVVPVLDGERFTMRILVDHSIVEAFAQGGRTCITSRVYPTKAINSAAKLFVFNNATETNVKITSIKVWQMGSAFIQPYPFD